MATITGLTAARMLEIEAASVVDGEVVGDNLILTKHDGSTINAGDVRGPQGDEGPVGSDLVVVTAQDILNVGISGQIRAGRQLSASDFTNMGLSAPIALYNLGNTSDSSGNGRTLTNKGSIPFQAGINGSATTAARFAGSSSQAFYIADTGGSDPFRVRTATIGAWVKTAKRGTFQSVMSKYGSASGNRAWYLQINTSNTIELGILPAGTDASLIFCPGQTDICDDGWHFVVGVFDGATLYVYVDGVLDGVVLASGVAYNTSTAPFNIGAHYADGSTAGTSHFFGKIDEAFITGDILTEDQIRNLYCAKIAHALGSTPKRAGLNVKRRRKGAALLSSDFSSTPLRLHNFSAGSVNNEGSASNGTAGSTATFANNGTSLPTPGVDGTPGNAYLFYGAQSLSATDTGLPSGTNAWSFGQWVKTVVGTGNPAAAAWGNASSSGDVLHWLTAPGTLVSRCANPAEDISTGVFIADGQWHFILTTADNAALDGLKRKVYVDGKLVGSATTLSSVILVGSNGYRIGSGYSGGLPWNGAVDTAFVCNYAMSAEEQMELYLKGTQALGVSPKNAGDHVELMTSTDLYCIFDSLEGQHQVDLAVA